MKLKVSIVTPVYNQRPYLAECLDSVLSQTLHDIEIVCVDDGSTDGSAQVLDEYAVRDPRVKVIHQANAGAGPARNAGMAAASGEFIAFMDADDRYPAPETLEMMYDEAKASGVDICGGGMELVTPNGREASFSGRYDGNAFAETKTMDYCDYQFDFGFSRFIYSRSLIESAGLRFPSLRYYEDPPFFARAMAAAGRFRALSRPTYTCVVAEKRIEWLGDGCRKVLDLLEGLRMNLELARERGYARLREYSCLSVDWTYCAVIRRALRANPRVRVALDAVEALSGYPSRPTTLEAEWDRQRVKIFMVYHRPSPFIGVEPFVPIQVGSAPDIPDVVSRDDSLDNIAAKNPNFCELTAQYWIWKNVKAEYVGLMHYRRLISLTKCDEWTFKDFSEETRAKFGWNAERIDELLRDYDILLPPDCTVFPPGESGHVMTPYEFHCYEHRKCDIDAAIAAIHELTPQYDGYARKALCEDTHECFGNICVMHKDFFDAYSEWLFKILFEVERRIKLPKNSEEARLFGFLSERLVMVWLGYARDFLGARVWHAPSMPFGDFPENLCPALALRARDAEAEPKVSVVIPVYNVERYLPKCLNSVCGQCLDEIEVICVDDGSTDGSAAILAEAARTDRRIKVVKGDHRGPGAARNRGIAVAKGKYLAFVDSDDWVDRFIWFRSVKKAELYDLDMVFFGVERVDDTTGERELDSFSRVKFANDEDGVYHAVFTWRDARKNVFDLCCYPVNRLIRRDFWGDKLFPEDVVMGEDVLPHVQLTLEAKRFGYIGCPFYFYRQRPGSSMTIRDQRALDHLKDIEAVLSYLRTTGRMDDLSGTWPHFAYAMMNLTFYYWPTRTCFEEIARWIAPHRAEFLGGCCFGLRVMVHVLDRGSYPFFVVMYHLLQAYRRSKDFVSAYAVSYMQMIRRRFRRIVRRMMGGR